MTTLDRADLVGQVTDWVRIRNRNPEFDMGGLTPATDLLETAVLDSVALVELLVYVQEEIGRELDLSDADPEEFVTIDGICSFALGRPGGEAAE